MKLHEKIAMLQLEENLRIERDILKLNAENRMAYMTGYADGILYLKELMKAELEAEDETFINP